MSCFSEELSPLQLRIHTPILLKFLQWKLHALFSAGYIPRLSCPGIVTLLDMFLSPDLLTPFLSDSLD